ncbi:MAG: hypothetical protein AMS25_15750 [Gemmatimonas sp. SM23_52]|nr:MAG: hypothetical protein AMS25_15750 [Gemmatimonas sp. SM23_52]
MRYPLAGRDSLAALTTGGGLAAGAWGLARAAAKRALGPLAVPMVVGGGLMWLGRSLGESFVEIGEKSLRVKLGAVFDEMIPLSEISRIEMTEWKIIGGLGVRTNLRDMVAVVTTTGPVADLWFWTPRRLPVIPRIYYVRAQHLLVSPENLDGFITDLRAHLQS